VENKKFEKLVKIALKKLPKAFKDKLENVAIVIEDEPRIETLKELKLGASGRLLGLYQGVPLEDRTHYYAMVLPDKITLFKSNIEKSCNSEDEVYDEVVHVLEHEIAHHFGISDSRLRDINAY
jgi:predicted Zn-dependent protease with MMP-like domain